MKSFTRKERVGGLIQRTLSEILIKGIKDPRLEGVTITGARVSPDFSYADVHFYRLGGDQDELQEALEGLESAGGFIRRELASRLQIRHTPELRFHLDESIDYGDHIEALISQIHKEDQRRQDGTPSGESDL